MDLSADLIWSIYKKRADAENQIKELKYDYGMEGFCSESFSATESAFRWVMVAYNLMSLFKQKVIAKKSMQTLSTLRFQCIAIGSYIITRGRSSILKLAVKDQKRDYIDELFINLGRIKYDSA
ncbi:MAG: transposase [Bacteroidia bacterium]|nr:transposase [Bacteroidia bacterium]